VALRRFTPTPGNDRHNPALPQGVADRLAAVAFIPGQPVGPQPGAACSGPLDCSVVEQGRQGHLLVALPTGYREDDGLAAAFGADMDIRPAPTATPAKCLVSRPPLPPAACPGAKATGARTTEPSTKCSVQSRFLAASP
jgi:hypothetical protein